MMKRLRKLYQDESGGMSLLMMAVVFFGILMFVLLLNFIKVFAVDNQANTAAQQGSLAATGVVYKQAMNVIERYSYPCGDDICFLIEDYHKEKRALSGESLSENEKHRKAIDKTLLNRMSRDATLKRQIRLAMQRATAEIPGVVKNVIRKNNAKVSDTKIKIFNNKNRIEVITSAEFESSEVPGFMRKMKEDLPQIGMGVEVPFIQVLNWPSRTLQLR